MACGYACGVTVVLKLGLEVWYFGTTPSSKKPKKRKPDESAPVVILKCRSEHGTAMCGVLGACALRSSSFVLPRVPCKK